MKKQRQTKNSFLGELVRRQVVKVTIGYVALVWVVIQVADIVLESFGAPTYIMQSFIFLAVLGLPLAIVLSWLLEVTPEGIQRDNNGSVLTDTLRDAIAVLPLTNMSSDPDIEHLADGLSDNIITGCQQQLAMAVTSRNSTFVYKDQPVTIKDVASELDVSYILEGSIQKQGEKIRVNAQLISGADDRHLWADYFDRDLGDSFALQDELTQTIVSRIKETLSALTEGGIQNVESPAENKGKIVGFEKPVFFTLLTVLLTIPLALMLTLYLWREEITGDILPGFELSMLGLLTATLAVMAGIFYWQRKQRLKLLQADAIVQIETYIESNHLTEAFDLANEFKATLAPAEYDENWWDQFSAISAIRTEPAVATVSYRPYNGRNMPFRALGTTPVADFRLPLGAIQIKIEAPGYNTQVFATTSPSTLLSPDPTQLPSIPDVEPLSHFTLARNCPEDMVFVSKRFHGLSLQGLNFRGPISVPEFFLDKFPVSNAAYKEFVDAGGYDNPAYWEDLPWPEGSVWQDHISKLVDSTGRPGPADWELGEFTGELASHPVTGVSWYEASAYATYAGKRLPDAYEWAVSALTADSPVSNLPAALMKYSNFLGKAKSTPGEFDNPGVSGAYDLFGNVREWGANLIGEGRANLGGCYCDEPYFGVWVNSESPFQRAAINGFRCLKADQLNPATQAPIDRVDRTYQTEKPVADDVYKALVQPLLPTRQPANFQVSGEILMNNIRVQSGSIESGYGERIDMYLALPDVKNVAGGKEAIAQTPLLVVMPGMGSWMGNELSDEFEHTLDSLNFVVTQLGMAIASPAWSGANNRFDFGPFSQVTNPDENRSHWFKRIKQWVQEGSQMISMAHEHDSLDGERVCLLAVSYGGNLGMPIAALNPFKANMIFASNLLSHHMFGFADAINHLPRVSSPTLMINGRFDSIISADESLLNRRLELLGATHKKQVIYDASHWPFPQSLFKKEVAGWLTEYS